MASTTWESYEEVAQYLLNQFAEHFGLGRVEGKQIIPGKITGTEWEIDVKGVKSDGEGFFITECRRYTTRRLNQDSMAALAFKIYDTGAQGGIIVSPLGLQSGAEKVASSTNVHEVTLHPESTTSDYIMGFLNQIFVGVSETINVTEHAHVDKG